MSRIEGIRRLLHIHRSRAGIERAVDDELRFHFDMTMRNLMDGGMSPDDARRETERRFGDVERTRERLASIDRARAGREQRAEWWSAFVQDTRYALRGLRLKPGFAIAVVLTLGLGIGANATMFGIVDRLLLRPPDYLAAPDRVARVYRLTTYRGKEDSSSDYGYRRYLDLREGTTSFDAMTPMYYDTRAIGDGEATRELKVGVSGPDLWKMFDVKPVIGRFFTGQDDVLPAGSRVAVLAYGFWQSQYAGRKDVIGSPIRMGSVSFTIIGVAPEGFNGFEMDPLVAFVPIVAEASVVNSRSPGDPWYSTYYMTWFDLFARRKPHVTQEAADADLSQATLRSYRAELAKNPENPSAAIVRPHAYAGPVLEERGPHAKDESKVAVWLIGVAGIVLLIACANVANLLVARALRRRREIAVRLALGVSRGRLLVQLMTESTLLAVLGGLAGLAVAQWGGAGLRSLLLTDAAPTNAWTDHRILIFSAVLVLLAGLLTGLMPALQASRTDISGSLKAGSREGTMQRSRLRVGLLIMQAALSVVLLVGAGLFLKSLSNVEQQRLGFDYDQLLRVRMNGRGVQMDSAQLRALYERMRERAEQIPGVEHAAFALTTPFASTWSNRLFVEGIDSVQKLGEFTLQAGSANFFSTFGTRILRGRDFTAGDRFESPRVVIVSKSMGDRLWHGHDALGKCIRVRADTAPCMTVVGIAEDIRRRKLGEAEDHYYMPLEQYGFFTSSTMFVRTHGHAATQVDVVRRALQALMPGAAYITVGTMTALVAPKMRSWKLGATMFALFGALALVLAAIGLYSVIAYNVAQRTHEMGVRVALGAQRNDVISLIVREGLTVVLPGVVIGAGVSLFAGRWIAPLLFGVSPKDPPVIVAVILTLVVVAVVASWVPAMRASRIDPNEALRSD